MAEKYVKLDSASGNDPGSEWNAAEPMHLAGVTHGAAPGALTVTLPGESTLNLTLKKGADGKHLLGFDA